MSTSGRRVLSAGLRSGEFVRRLDEVRNIRNVVRRLNPDPPPPESVEKLRNISRLLGDYGHRDH